MIRVKTLRNMAAKHRAVYRVRRRAYEGPPGRPVLDTDGSDTDPDTWARCEEEYFSNFGYAYVARRPESDSVKRQGYMDQVKASRVLWLLERAGVELATFTDGRYTLVTPVTVASEGIA